MVWWMGVDVDAVRMGKGWIASSRAVVEPICRAAMSRSVAGEKEKYRHEENTLLKCDQTILSVYSHCPQTACVIRHSNDALSS